MGCGSPREKIEDEMMVYKLERMEVQMEKEKELKKLAEIEGHTIERHFVPDYIDPKFQKKKDYMLNKMILKMMMRKKQIKQDQRKKVVKKLQKKLKEKNQKIQFYCIFILPKK